LHPTFLIRGAQQDGAAQAAAAIANLRALDLTFAGLTAQLQHRLVWQARVCTTQ